MKLLICTQGLDPNDPVTGFFAAWVREFAQHCEIVTVVALSGVHAETLPSNVRVRSLGKEFSKKDRSGEESKVRGIGKSLWKYPHAFVLRLGYFIRFYRIIVRERHDYDVVFVHNVGPKFVIFGVPIWRMFRKKIALWYVHKEVDRKLRIAEKLVDIIFSSAPESFRLATPKVYFVGHGIDTDTLSATSLRPDPECFTILQVGRITPIKHCEVLIRAAALFAREFRDSFKVLFVGTPLAVGDEKYAQELRGLVSELKLSDRVFFEGGVAPERLRDYYARAHVTINMVPTGGVDKVALESAAMGVPVFTTNQAFVRIFGDLASRFVLPPLDSESASRLAESLRELAEEGFAEEDRKELRAVAASYASLPALITRIMTHLNAKTS